MGKIKKFYRKLFAIKEFIFDPKCYIPTSNSAGALLAIYST